jgi:hypothetical protein
VQDPSRQLKEVSCELHRFKFHPVAILGTVAWHVKL